MKEIEKIQELFCMWDYSKDLLFNSTNKMQEDNARSFENRIIAELKELYVLPTNA